MKKIIKVFLFTLLLISILGVVNSTEITSKNIDEAKIKDGTSTLPQDDAKIINDNTNIKTDINYKTSQNGTKIKNINPTHSSNKNNFKSAGLDSMTIIIKEGQTYNQIINSVRFMDATREIIIELPENQKFDITSQFICGNKRNTKIFTINGNGSVFNGQNINSFITVDAGFTLNLNNVTITNTTGELGCVINNSGTANINNSTITKNIGGKSAIYNNEGNLSITYSALTDNIVYDNGGVICNIGTYKISDTTFYNNTPANFIINDNNRVKLVNNDDFIDINDFAIMVDDEIYHGSGLEELEQYIIPTESLNVKLLLNGTNTTNNIFILKETPEKIKIAKVNISSENPICGGITDIIATFIVDNNPINNGDVIFRLNDKTIRNNDGEVIYVEIHDGKAVLENISITNTWVEMETTIQAIFMGNNEVESIWTDKNIVTASKARANLNINAPGIAHCGDKITLKASVTNENSLINTGRVVFKLNGKTLKDADGKALYVNVVNSLVTTNYTIPANLKAKTYNLTAVFTDYNYERSEKDTQLTVIS